MGNSRRFSRSFLFPIFCSDRTIITPSMLYESWRKLFVPLEGAADIIFQGHFSLVALGRWDNSIDEMLFVYHYTVVLVNGERGEKVSIVETSQGESFSNSKVVEVSFFD